MPATRRLAAIFAADVVGYSRLMSDDEEGTLDRLKAHRRDLVDPKIDEHRGRIVKTTGDGLLAEFASVVDAVRCTVEIQRGMIERDTDLPEDQRIRFRVGINLGDIIIDRGDIFGDGVNVAARLEALAEPGGMCISGTVRDHVGDRLPYPFADMGLQSVKNIARPVAAFALPASSIAETPLVEVRRKSAWLRLGGRRAAFAVALCVIVVSAGVWWFLQGRLAPHGIPGPPPVSTEAKTVPRLSIVVLPFANLSSDPEQDYFADAVTDDVTTDLSRIEGSFVISRSTAFTYKNKGVDTKQLGHDLGVRYVLEGSVRRFGDRVQVNVQLIDAESGTHVWADRFDTDRGNLAKAQSDITARLARSLQLELLQVVSRQIELEKPVNPEARDLIMQGWASYFRPETKESLGQTQQFFERALEMDPKSAEAMVGVAAVLVEYVAVSWSKTPEQDKSRAEELLTAALAVNQNTTRLHFTLGLLRRMQGRWAEARGEFEEELARDRNNAGAMLQLGFTLNNLGQPEAALPHLEQALRLSPVGQNVHFIYFGLGACHMYLGHLDAAVDFLRKAYASNNRIFFTPLYLAAALGLRGDIEEARVVLGEALKLTQIRSIADLHSTSINYRSPPYAELAARTLDVGLRRAGLPDE